MRVLVTGAGGFVGRHLFLALNKALGENGTLVPTVHRSSPPGLRLQGEKRLDITSPGEVDRAIGELRPTHVLNLAGLSTIVAADEDQRRAWDVHLFGTLHLAQAIQKYAPDCLLIHVGSGQVYGDTGRSVPLLNEDCLVAPTNISMATKAAADLALGALRERGLRSVRFRPFNHSGRGQSTRFALPNFARQIREIKAGRQAPVIRVGNVDTERDFLDVRDVAAAYARAVVLPPERSAGEIFNIASGIPRRMRDVLDQMFSIAGINPDLEVDPQLLRPAEIARFVGDSSKARRLLDWVPVHHFEDTLREVLDYTE